MCKFIALIGSIFVILFSGVASAAGTVTVTNNSNKVLCARASVSTLHNNQYKLFLKVVGQGQSLTFPKTIGSSPVSEINLIYVKIKSASSTCTMLLTNKGAACGVYLNASNASKSLRYTINKYSISVCPVGKGPTWINFKE